MKARSPRHGSMQFWPHRRAKKTAAVVKSYATIKDAQPLGFAGFKVGMTHVHYTETNKNSPKKGEKVMIPVTVLECPPLKVVGVRTYTHKYGGIQPQSQIFIDNKNLPNHAKKHAKFSSKTTDIPTEDVDAVRLLVMTQPYLTSTGSKSPDIFEVAVGGKLDEQIQYAKDNLGKDISVADVFKQGEQIDIHGVTTGKGFSSAVARFGIRTRSHKSEKGIRTAGSLGSWSGQGHMMYRVPAPGKHGYYTRTTYNQRIVAIGDKPEDINAAGGFVGYGNVKNTYVLIKGSVHGPSKRLVRLLKPIRANPKARALPEPEHIHTGSHQG